MEDIGIVGTQLRLLRMERGYTIATVAERSHISKSVISKIENHAVAPSTKTLAFLGDGLAAPLWRYFVASDVLPVLPSRQIKLLHIMREANRLSDEKLDLALQTLRLYGDENGFAHPSAPISCGDG